MKCDHHAEPIEEEAFICRYCAQNPDKAAMHPRALPLVWQPTIADMNQLGDKFEASLSPKGGVITEIWESTRQMLREVFLPVLRQCAMEGEIGEGELCREFRRMEWPGAMCGLACYGIGVEEATRGLVDLQAAGYVQRICRAYGSQAAYPLLRLAHRGYMPEEVALTRARFVIDHLLTWGTGMWGRGYVEGASALRKDSGFLDAILKLDELKEAR